MDYMDQYPLINAEPINDNGRQESQHSYFIFNAQTNKGYSLDGLAALLCKKMNGKKTLRSIIAELEADYELETGKFNKEIHALIKDLGDNNLLILKDAPVD
ncbi:MAG: PqqD family protein [Rhizobacter sp.]|nr:PqqD family protein [Bacteriovorax sp.]